MGGLFPHVCVQRARGQIPKESHEPQMQPHMPHYLRNTNSCIVNYTSIPTNPFPPTRFSFNPLSQAPPCCITYLPGIFHIRRSTSALLSPAPILSIASPAPTGHSMGSTRALLQLSIEGCSSLSTHDCVGFSPCPLAQAVPGGGPAPWLSARGMPLVHGQSQ